MKTGIVSLLFLSSFAGRIEINAQEVRFIRDPENQVRRIVLTSSGAEVYSCWENGDVKVYRTDSGKLVREFKVRLQEGKQLNWLDVTKGEKNVLVGGFGTDVLVLDSGTLKEVQVFKGHNVGVSAFAVLPDQLSVLSGDDNWNVFLWNLKTGKKTKSSDSLEKLSFFCNGSA